MTTFARKLKSQGCTWALLGATAVALGTATAPSVAAEETGTQNYVQILSTQEVSYTAIVTRGTDAINTKPWGTAGKYRELSGKEQSVSSVHICIFLPRLFSFIAKLISGISYSITFHSSGSLWRYNKDKRDRLMFLPLHK